MRDSQPGTHRPLLCEARTRMCLPTSHPPLPHSLTHVPRVTRTPCDVQLVAYTEAVALGTQPAAPIISPAQALVLLRDAMRLRNAACMHARYFTDLARPVAAAGLDQAARWHLGGRKLRVGYISEDFGHTSVGQLVQARSLRRAIRCCADGVGDVYRRSLFRAPLPCKTRHALRVHVACSDHPIVQSAL
jgi:hypothetical protein